MEINGYAIKPFAALRDADLRGADLRDADLRGAGLQDADLRGADLQDADLRGADLQDANLQDANLQDADLRGAALRDANLQDANLQDVDLRDADLRDAALQDADLRGADLQDADLRGADLRGVVGVERTYIVPETGSFEAWKKCIDNVLVKLRIPAAARRSNATGRKCRAEYVEVLDVIGAQVGVTSAFGPRTEYRPGDTVFCDNWCEDRWQECAGGIHFYMTRAEAEAAQH